MSYRIVYGRDVITFTALLMYRSIVIRQCGTAGATVWSQEIQACVNRGSVVRPPRGHRTPTDAGHRQPSYHKHRGGTTAGHGNPCRHGGPPFYRPHQTSSTLYVQCSAAGRAFVRKCPRGLRWNQRALTCDRSAFGTVYQQRSST